MSLADRVIEALKAGKSAGMATLIEDVEAGILAAERRNTQAAERALDPFLAESETAEARQTAQDATYERDRLVNAAKRLREARSSFIAAEQQAERRRMYDDALAKRDAAVESLRDYPELANAIGEILAEVHAAENAVMLANQNLPAGVQGLEGVETLSRGPMLDAYLTAPMSLLRIILPAMRHRGMPIYGPDRSSLYSTPVFTPEITSSAERPSSDAETAEAPETVGARQGASAPNSNPGAARSAAASDRTGEAGVSWSAPSPVRPMFHDAGEAA
ncbi:hypothetical protein D3218_19055 [Aureimonas flava]|uniref:Uncharacterized protein n=1 Tax=Aureimonas flava TaxID=2320271 RepID=A0A3A1WHB2_9HYPH|nr:hypothetical protein [Aureimonas flava]RIX97162.1 hypothetical protein D3218_19055 [Aureimonas flava]